ncbi:MAG: hypothetical protein AB1775_03530 [Bacteroidota bacterium]
MGKDVPFRNVQDKRMLEVLEFLQQNYDFKFDIGLCTALYKEKRAAEDQFTFLNPRDFDTLKINILLEFNFSISNKLLTHLIDILTVTPLIEL